MEYQIFVWLFFPLAFIIHDLEEILVQHRWMLSHKDSLLQRFPKMSPMIEQLCRLNTKAFTIAALEELAIIIVATVCIVDVWSKYVWIPLFLAFSLHLLIHIGQAIVIKGYVPGLVSSIILLPYSYIGMTLIWNAQEWMTIVWTIVGILAMVLNLKFAHWLGKRWGE